MISKELLTEALGEKRVILNYETSIDKTELHYGHIDIEEDGFINIHELVHKCKEWAKNKGYVVGTDLDKVNVWSIKERIIVNHFEVYFEDYLEFEFKACQWILENKGLK